MTDESVCDTVPDNSARNAGLAGSNPVVDRVDPLINSRSLLGKHGFLQSFPPRDTESQIPVGFTQWQPQLRWV